MFSSGEQMPLPQESFSLRAQGGQPVSDSVTGTLSLPLQDLMEGDSNGDMPNLSFYKNEIPFRPNGACLAACSSLLLRVPSPLSLPLGLLGPGLLGPGLGLGHWGTGAYSFQVAPQRPPQANLL